MKKLISIALSLVMLLSSFAVTTVAAAEPTYSETVEVTSAEQLVNATIPSGTKYVLTTDIDLTESVTAASSITIEDGACLDGDGNTIFYSGTSYRFYVNGSSGRVCNVNFGSMENPFRFAFSLCSNRNANSSPITFDGVNFFMKPYANTADDNAGVIVQAYGEINFNDCNMYFDYGTGTGKKDKYLGGYISRQYAGSTVTFNNCTVAGDITPTASSSRAAGFVGYVANGATLGFTNCSMDAAVGVPSYYAAGYVELIEGGNITFTNCRTGAASSVTVTNGNSAGFVCRALTTSVLTFNNCVAEGTVKTTASADCRVTGFVAIAGGSASLDFDNCISDGTLSLTNGRAAGFLAYADGAVTADLLNCANYADINESVGSVASVRPFVAGLVVADFASEGGELTVTNCTNYGDISGRVAAGVAQVNNTVTATVENCVNYGSVTGSSHAAGIVGHNTSFSANTVNVLNCENYGTINGVNGGGIYTFDHLSSKTAEYTSVVTIDNCLNLGTVTADGGNSGGIVGFVDNEYSYPVVTNSYALADADVVVGSGELDGTSANNLTLADTSAAAAVELLNAENYSVKYMQGGDGEAAIVIATPVLRTIQDTDVVDYKQSIRLIGTINSLNYDYVGFKVTTKLNGDVKTENKMNYCANVYSSVIGGGNTYNAEDLYGEYIFALSINDVPVANETDVVVIEVTPFAVSKGGDAEAPDYVGASYTITYRNGECVSFN